MSTPAGPPGSQQPEADLDADETRRRTTAGDRLMDANEVAQIFGGSMTDKTVKRRYRAWGLPAHHIGKELRWWESDVYEYIRKQRT